MIRRAALALAACLAALPAGAETCRLALALAIDVSRSISPRDFAIQTGGLVAALRDPEVQAAFLRPARPVALAVYQWSGQQHQDLIADWRMIGGPDALEAVARLIEAETLPMLRQPTALGTALAYGRRLHQRAPLCDAQVLDVSGDGQNNDGISPESAYAAEDFGDLTVNALAITAHEIFLVEYFRNRVIRGPGAFVEVANRQEDFPAAIRRKLIREVSERVLGSDVTGSRRPPSL